MLASAAFWIAQAIFVSLLYAGTGSIFGALRDLSNAQAVALMAPLLWALYRMAAGRSMSFSLIGLLLGMLGVLLAAGASFAIFFGLIDFFESLPPVVGGMGLAGLGLMILFQVVRFDKRMPVWARKWGLARITSLIHQPQPLRPRQTINCESLFSATPSSTAPRNLVSWKRN